jgi:hypothetical protein
MNDSLYTDAPLKELFRGLTSDLKAFVQQEMELTQREMSEKLACYLRNVAIIAVGGVVAYAGLIVLLCGLGVLLGFAFQKWGVEDRLLATFIGLGVIGLLIVLTGALLLLKGRKALATSSLAPVRTIATLKPAHEVGGKPKPSKEAKEVPKRPVEEIQRETVRTKERVGDQLEEIVYRTSPAHIKHRAIEHVRTHRMAWGLGVFAVGLGASFVLVRKLRNRGMTEPLPRWPEEAEAAEPGLFHRLRRLKFREAAARAL